MKIESLKAELKIAHDEIKHLRSAIVQCLNENSYLADGDNCTLRVLTRAVPDWEEV